MEAIIYNNDVLKQHSLYRHCASTLNAVSERDYPNKNYFNPLIECLDMDTYEKKQCSGNADCTVDTVIGISTCKNKVTSSNRLLLVELRLDYINAKNLSKSELEQKVEHTKDLLSSELSIEQNNIFIFTDNVAQQARSFMTRLMKGTKYSKLFVVWSVSDFKNSVKSIDDMPYIPINNPSLICKDLDKSVESQQWKKLFKKIHFLRNKCVSLIYKNPYEYESLSETIIDWWNNFRQNNPRLPNENDELDAQVTYEDDVEILKK